MKSFHVWFLIVFLLTLGCDRGQQMIKPVMNEIPVVEESVADTTEETTPEVSDEITDIFTDIEIPPEPTIPAGADVLETDRVFHFTTDDFLEDAQTWGRTDIQVGENPSQNKDVLDFFQDTKAWAEKFCGKSSYDQPPRLNLTFRSRAEREAFKESLPGGWTEDPSNKENWWYIHVENTLIVDSTDVYYSVYFNGADACAFRNQPQ